MFFPSGKPTVLYRIDMIYNIFLYCLQEQYLPYSLGTDSGGISKTSNEYGRLMPLLCCPGFQLRLNTNVNTITSSLSSCLASRPGVFRVSPKEELMRHHRKAP